MHQHNHSHIKDDSDNRIAMAFFLNVGFTIIEFIGGWLTNSTAIMADAVHDLGDLIYWQCMAVEPAWPKVCKPTIYLRLPQIVIVWRLN